MKLAKCHWDVRLKLLGWQIIIIIIICTLKILILYGMPGVLILQISSYDFMFLEVNGIILMSSMYRAGPVGLFGVFQGKFKYMHKFL